MEGCDEDEVKELLERDDKWLKRIENLGEGLVMPLEGGEEEEGGGKVEEVERLGALLAELEGREVEARLGRVFWEVYGAEEGMEVEGMGVEELQNEVEELKAEVGTVCEQAVEEEFVKPVVVARERERKSRGENWKVGGEYVSVLAAMMGGFVTDDGGGNRFNTSWNTWPTSISLSLTAFTPTNLAIRQLLLFSPPSMLSSLLVMLLSRALLWLMRRVPRPVLLPIHSHHLPLLRVETYIAARSVVSPPTSVLYRLSREPATAAAIPIPLSSNPLIPTRPCLRFWESRFLLVRMWLNCCIG